jgi:hypothetical protein
MIDSEMSHPRSEGKNLMGRPLICVVAVTFCCVIEKVSD